MRKTEALIIRDTVTRKVYGEYTGPDSLGYYRAKTNSMLGALVSSIQDRHATRVVTIKVLSGRSARRYTRTRDHYNGILGKAQQFARTWDEDYSTETGRWSITEPEARQSMKDHGQVAFPKVDIMGDAAILVSATRLKLDAEKETDDSDMTPAQIKRAFVKRSVGSSKNRVFVQTVMPFLA